MFRRMAPSGNSLYGKISPDSNEIRNYSRKEIAKMFGISQTTVDYHVNKAIERLLVSLRDYTPAIALLCCLTILFQKI